MPDDIPEKLLILMADIFPTGYSTAMNARRLADEDREYLASTKVKGDVAVVVGAGPVSLLSLTALSPR